MLFFLPKMQVDVHHLRCLVSKLEKLNHVEQDRPSSNIQQWPIYQVTQQTKKPTLTNKQTHQPNTPITSTNIFSEKIRPWNWGASHGIFGKPDRPGFGGLDCGELLYWKHHFPWLLLHPGRGTFRFWAPLSWEVGWLVQLLETSPSPEKLHGGWKYHIS